MTHKPHDALFKTTFEHPRHAAELLERLLPADLSAAIDWSTTTPEAGSYVDEELADHHSDLLFSVDLHGHRTLIYLLFEHQSTVDPDMCFRMLVYLVRIWDRFRKHSRAPFPPVIPFLLSHAPGGWTAPRSFHELFAPHPATIPGLARFVPNFTMFVEDLHGRDDAGLRALSLQSLPTLALWLLRDGRDLTMLTAGLATWGELLNEVAKLPSGRTLLSYLARFIEFSAWPEFYAKLKEMAPEAGQEFVSYADHVLEQGRARGREEGRREGREEGREEGQLELLTKLIEVKFGSLPAHVQARLAAGTPFEFERWAARLFEAKTLDEIFTA